MAATAYILGTLGRMGAISEVITESDRRDGAAWIRSLHIGNEQYRDPALLDRKSPGWPDSAPWPKPAMLACINQYSRNALAAFLGCGKQALAEDMPPPGWPQPDDNQESMIEWIRTLPWDHNVWGAGSHAKRMAAYMLRWCRQGLLPVEPIHRVFNFFYEIQDPHTGLWGTPNQPTNVRINGTFKLFTLLRDQLDLPLPHAERIVDHVLSELQRPDYDKHASGCDEFDNWYVLALALGPAGGHRAQEASRLAGRRILRVLDLFRKPDGGFSYYTSSCATHWIGFDMAEPLPQGDAVGAATLSHALSICCDLAGVRAAGGWSTEWRIHTPDPEERCIVMEGIRAV